MQEKGDEIDADTGNGTTVGKQMRMPNREGNEDVL
jgi:hypothetical protein